MQILIENMSENQASYPGYVLKTKFVSLPKLTAKAKVKVHWTLVCKSVTRIKLERVLTKAEKEMKALFITLLSVVYYKLFNTFLVG